MSSTVYFSSFLPVNDCPSLLKSSSATHVLFPSAVLACLVFALASASGEEPSSKKDYYDAHYSLTPYSFRPKSAKNMQLDTYFDLGQGLLETIYEIYQNLEKEKLKIRLKVK